jgi:TonB family protein
MIAAPPLSEIEQPGPAPRLLVELPSRREVFVENLRDLISPPQLPRLELRSAPAPFWPDVFVKRELPWRRFLQSGAGHVIAFAMLIAVTRFFAMQPRAVAVPAFDHSQVVTYQPSEYLPPLDTRTADAAQPRKADPEFSRQPIISVPAEADNRAQTVVAPPSVKLRRDLALPNIVSWADRTQKPQLAIPDVPLTPAAERARIAPNVSNAAIAPPPDAARITRTRNSLDLQTSVVAPPPDLRTSRPTNTYAGPQASVIAPPPAVDAESRRPLGQMNVGRSSVIAPAPRLAVGEQRSFSGRSSGAGGSQVVPPPPSVSASGSSAGSTGRVVALSMHPAVGAPPSPPAGNRRGTFAATPEGRAGASGTPGAKAGSGKDGSGADRKTASNLPAGLYVGKAAENPAAAAGNSGQSTNPLKPNLTASIQPPRVAQADNSAKLSEAERSIFGDRKFYSLTLNMPNLNSAGGSWVIRFAELHHDSGPQKQDSPAADLSQPAATRKVDPAYPLQVIQENVSGTVIVYAIIHADGSVGNVRVIRGVDDRIDQFAAQAVAKCQFHPAEKNGTPVDVEATFRIPFHPPRRNF